MNADEVIRELEQAPRQIRVKCPDGHFIVDITLSVVDGQLATRVGRSRKELRRRRSSQRLVLYADVIIAADRNVNLKCADSHCKYNPTRNDLLLAVELADAALRGHAEYRLTW